MCGFMLKGIAVCEGVSVGKARLVTNATLKLSDYTQVPESLETELSRFDNAVSLVQTELADLQSSAAQLPEEFSMFLTLHRMFLEDPHFTGEARKLIVSEGITAERAIVTRALSLIDQLNEAEEAYFRERHNDVRQITERILKALSGAQTVFYSDEKEPVILVANDLFPSDTLLFKNKQNCVGILTDSGGVTSHTAILGRGMNIPAIVGARNARRLIQENDWIIVDGFEGIIIVNPAERILAQYQALSSEYQKKKNRRKMLRFAKNVTKDNVGIRLHANIESLNDIADVKTAGAHGVGLFRSEFLFMDRPVLPDEEEQFQIYRDVAIAMDPDPVVIRTLDVGADKLLNQNLGTVPKNPALGQRGVRYSLAQPNIFITQLRAILRASIYGKVKMMFPMVTSSTEVNRIFSVVDQAKQSLIDDKIPFDPFIEIGAMIEVPAAAMSIRTFAPNFDFFSVGSNDLIQYSLAVDRCDSSVASLYNPYHPGVLQLIAKIAKDSYESHVPVSICGEIAGDAAFTRFLIGLGFRDLSMHPANILKVKEQILSVDTRQLNEHIEKILNHHNPDHVVEAIKKLNITEF